MKTSNHIQKLIDDNLINGDYETANKAHAQMGKIMRLLEKLDFSFHKNGVVYSISIEHVDLDALLEELR